MKGLTSCVVLLLHGDYSNITNSIISDNVYMIHNVIKYNFQVFYISMIENIIINRGKYILMLMLLIDTYRCEKTFEFFYTAFIYILLQINIQTLSIRHLL